MFLFLWPFGSAGPFRLRSKVPPTVCFIRIPLSNNFPLFFLISLLDVLAKEENLTRLLSRSGVKGGVVKESARQTRSKS